MRILTALQANENVHTTVSGDFTDCHKWIRDAHLMICYVAGPFADEYQTGVIRDWIGDGGRWLALHGSSGGKAERIGREDGRRRWVKTDYHEALGWSRSGRRSRPSTGSPRSGPSQPCVCSGP